MLSVSGVSVLAICDLFHMKYLQQIVGVKLKDNLFAKQHVAPVDSLLAKLAHFFFAPAFSQFINYVTGLHEFP